MIRPVILRKNEGSSGERIVEMIASRLNRVDMQSVIYADGNVITIVNSVQPKEIKNYFRRLVDKI